MGSRFIASEESEFSKEYKSVPPAANAQDTILATGALGPIRLWKNEYSLHHGLVADKQQKMAEEAQMTQEDIITKGKAYEAAYTGDINSGAVLLGQSIGIIHQVKKVRNIVEEIVQDAESRLKAAASYIK